MADTGNPWDDYKSPTPPSAGEPWKDFSSPKPVTEKEKAESFKEMLKARHENQRAMMEGWSESFQEGGKGLVQAVTHPIQTASGIFEAVSHPVETAGSIVQSAAKTGTNLLTAATTPTSKLTKEQAKEVGKSIGGVTQMAIGGVNPAKSAAAKFIGETTKTTEAAARAWEKVGVKVDPASVRGVEPRPSAGLTEAQKIKNQKIFNKTFTKDTGVVSDTINDEFLNKRFEELGKSYDSIYNNRKLKIDRGTVDQLRQLIDQEKSLGPAGARVPTKAAQTVSDNWDILVGPVNNKAKFVNFDGTSLQRLRTKLNEIARNTSDTNERGQARAVVRMLDNAVAKNNPTVGEALKLANTQYRATSALWDAKGSSIFAGDISPMKFGEWLERNEYSGTESQRIFGEHGRNANLISAQQKSPVMESVSAIPLWSELKKALGAVGRTQTARNIQREIAEKMMRLPDDHIPTEEGKKLQQLLEQLKQQQGKTP